MQPANFCDACGFPVGPQAWLSGFSGPAATHNKPPTRTPAAIPPETRDEPPASFELERYIPRELAAKLQSARDSGVLGERRIVTILFCDIVGSTRMAERLDPEEWSEIVNGAFARMVPPVYKYEGTVARLTGDGLLAFFGAPIAHEDDPRRAILAGLEIVDGIHAHRQTLPPESGDLDVRIGINTGLVVVGAVGSDMRLEYSALGDAINLAARMEQTAEPGTVRIAEDTFRLVSGQFVVEPLGGIEVKGKTQPVFAYRVLRRRTGRERRLLQPLFHSPLINRSREWEKIRLAFDELGQGRGSILFLTGEAGLGKSRLMVEALERLLPDINSAGRAYESAAQSYELNLPYGSIIRLLRQVLDLSPDDGVELFSKQLVALPAGDSETGVLARLLGFLPEQPGPGLSGEAFTRQLVDCLLTIFRALASPGPIVLALDDLQWMDASSADTISRLFHLVEREPILFLCAVRRDRHTPGWRLKETAERDLPHRLIEVALYPLTDAESRELLTSLLGSARLPDMLQTLIMEKAEGNPLFVEEVVHHLIERGHLIREAEDAPWEAAGPVESIDLPDSIQALMTARIDRLDEHTRRTLQIAAVIGRFFPLSPLMALVEKPELLDQELLELQRLELIRQVGRMPEPGYVFHHALTHEVAYNTILVKQRKAMHLRVAETIETLRADNPAVVAQVLAHHFFEGQAPDRALPYLIMSADAALQFNATTEAIANYERAIMIALDRKSTTAEIAKLYINRGRALELQSKFAEADLTYQDLERIALEHDDLAVELEALVAQGKMRANVTSLHDPAKGRELMDRALRLAQTLHDRPTEVRILWNLVNIDRFDINSLHDAITNGERAVAMARELGLREELAYLLNDLSDVYGTIGQMKQAGGVLEEAQALWRELGNEPMLADTLSNTSMWTFIKGDVAAAVALATEALQITTRIANIWGQAYSRGVRGLVYIYKGEFSRAIEDLTTAIIEAQEANFVGGQMLSHSFLSRAYLILGEFEPARDSALISIEIGRRHLQQFVGMGIGRLVAVNLAMGDITEAAETLADPLASIEHQQVLVKNEIQMARIGLSLAQGEYQEAVHLAQAGMDELIDIDYRVWLPDMAFSLAGGMLALGNITEARQALANCVTTAKTMGLRGNLWRYLAASAGVELADGKVEQAAAFYDESYREINFLLDNIHSDKLRAAFLGQPEVQTVLSSNRKTETTTP